MISHSGTNSNVVAGNMIGTNKAGSGAIALPDGKTGNLWSGIRVHDGPQSNRIGVATSADEANVISGNTQNGVHISGSGSDKNIIAGNYIGTNSGQSIDLGNIDHGVFIDGGNDTQVGRKLTDAGGTSVKGNYIWHNGGDGVYVESGRDNSILSNSIYSNTGLGIDLGTDGVTVHDIKDTDGAVIGATVPANGLQNYPLITSWEIVAEDVLVKGILHSSPDTAFTIDIFSNGKDDLSGFGEGQVCRKSFTTDKTDANGNVTFIATLPAGVTNLSATATDPDGNTSEFGTRVTIPVIEVEQIDFNGAANEDIRINETLDIGKGTSADAGDIEWIKTTRKDANTTAAWTTTQSAPAAFVRDNPMTAKVTFSSTGADASVFTIQGNNTGDYGNFKEAGITIAKAGGAATGTGFATFETAAKVGTVDVNNLSFEWRVQSIRVNGADYPLEERDAGKTTHRIYTVYDTGKGAMAEPWAEVLELAAGVTTGKGAPGNTGGVANAVADAHEVALAMTKGMFHSEWKTLSAANELRFLTAPGDFFYDPGVVIGRFTGGGGVGDLYDRAGNQDIDLNYFLDGIAVARDVPMLCANVANLQHLLLAAVGVDITPVYVEGTKTVAGILRPDALEPYNDNTRAGGRLYTDNVSFNYHQFGVYDSKVYDASLIPRTGQIWGDKTLNQYLDIAFVNQIANGERHRNVTSVVINNGFDTEPIITLSPNTVLENTDTKGGYVVGALAWVDVDRTLAHRTAALTLTAPDYANTDGAKFDVAGANLVLEDLDATGSGMVDFEATRDFDLNMIYTFYIRAVDGFGTDFHRAFDVFLIDIPGALHASRDSEAVVNSPANLSDDQLLPIVDAALGYWSDVGVDVTIGHNVDVNIADLDGTLLGLAGDGQLFIDIDAAGRGWFIDSSPGDRMEFEAVVASTEYHAYGQSEASGRYDLLTVVIHEFGHILGFSDLDPDTHSYNIMSGLIGTGVRRLPGENLWSDEILISSELIAPFDSIIIDNSKPVSLHPWAKRERTGHKWNGEALLWDAPRYIKPLYRIFTSAAGDAVVIHQHDTRRSFVWNSPREVRTDVVFGKLGVGEYFEAIDGIDKRLCDVFSFFSSGIE